MVEQYFEITSEVNTDCNHELEKSRLVVEGRKTFDPKNDFMGLSQTIISKESADHARWRMS